MGTTVALSPNKKETQYDRHELIILPFEVEPPSWLTPVQKIQATIVVNLTISKINGKVVCATDIYFESSHQSVELTSELPLWGLSSEERASINVTDVIKRLCLEVKNSLLREGFRSHLSPSCFDTKL